MKNIKIIIAGIALFLSSQKLVAQQDSINKKTDSINAAILDNYNKKIALIEQQRIDDSIKRVQLQTKKTSAIK